MRQVCCVCGIEYGEKPPNDDRVTHGLCPGCLPVELGKMKKEMAASKIVSTDSEQENTCSVSAI